MKKNLIVCEKILTPHSSMKQFNFSPRCQLVSLMAEKAIVLEEPFYMSYFLRPPKFQWPRFAINA